MRTTLIANDWQAHTMNDQRYYNNSPIAKHSRVNGSFGNDTAMSRTFNRKLKMRDTFTKIFPSYDHVEKTTYVMPSHAHKEFYYPEKNIDGEPMH